jgi:NCS1 nucleoside transporter family
MSVLSNEDLDPVDEQHRTWTTWNYAALWIGMSICIPTYMLASGLIADGMSWWQAIAAVALGNLIVLVPMLLNGHAGARYGIPFPVFARASFGTRGANVPAVLRAVVACGWFGIQTWIGGTALAVVAEKTVWPGIARSSFISDSQEPVEVAGKLALPAGAPPPALTINGTAVPVGADGSYSAKVQRDADHVVTRVVTDAAGKATTTKEKVSVGLLDVRSGDFLCFLLFWLVNMVVVWFRIDMIKKLLAVKSVFLPLATLGLLVWAYSAANGFGPMFSQPSRFQSAGEFMAKFIPAVTAMVGFWATLSLNIPDFTRYAVSQRAQITGQAIGLPPSMTAVAFVGVAVTSATLVLPQFGGQAEWDPNKVVRSFQSEWAVAFAMLCVVVSTLATNIAANIVSPANDFANLVPSHIGFRAGGLITGLVGIVMCPWLLIEKPNGYIFTWLIGYSALLGPIGGILIVDYFLLRKRELDVKDLYRHEGRYGYSGGWNPVALAALALGILPSLPGFLVQIGAMTAGDGLVGKVLVPLYHYAWFVGFAVSGGIYYAGMSAQGLPAPDPKAGPAVGSPVP